ncbi:MAG: tRNA uridine-5-carboxymethylaminomethyl(34) synthesis enzyme MnmG, partial [Planctomycetes bacterium]|nr:tRNA uridine-5-carboxymethylaminomethyl(34) synthesis enzyme MnmG [Planctomycetota bacterium]
IQQSQVPCWITYTNDAVHELIRANLHRAPMYSGQIQSLGPRYCPSIEDKVVRFADKTQHQVFLEPEGRTSDRVYVNGVSTSLPQDVQQQIIARIPGLEKARVLQWGYAVEYDFVPPEQIDASLMTRRVAGLFLAGQINGTSGYEEAAGQGLIAGINAFRRLAALPPLVLGRDQAYIGVMIDDLVTRGVLEPYRMFTSRAEHRMHLRYDNADARLTPIGREIGLVDAPRWSRYERKAERLTLLRATLAATRVEGRTLAEWLRRPEEDGERFLGTLPALDSFRQEADVWAAALVEIKYAGYLERQERTIEHFRSLEDRPIPAEFEYQRVPHLRREALERWTAVQPRSIGQAARVPGISPSDVTLLMVALARHSPDITTT